MENRNDIWKELEDLNSSLTSRPDLPFSVPEGYFDHFSATVLMKIKSEDPGLELQTLSPLLASVPKTIPYKVPDHYFEDNMEGISYVFGEVQSPILESAGKAMPYSVPADYFSQVENQVIDRVQPQPTAKVVKMNQFKWARMAVAAAVTGIIAFAGYHFYQEQQLDDYTASHADTMQQQTAVLTNRVEKELKNVSTSELDAFIKNVDVNASAATTRTSANGEVNEYLKNISDDELDRFLDEVPTANDELFIID